MHPNFKTDKHSNMIKHSNCYLCGNNDIVDFFKLPPVPTQDGNMGATEAEALNTVKGSIYLRFCKSCGYVGNEGHEPEKISFDDYDFSNDHSPLYAKFTEDLCDRLIEQYDLQGKTILDIGCGDGYFLKTICERSNSKGIGIDPGFDYSNKEIPEGLDINFIRDYYSEDYKDLKVDFIACRLMISLPSDPLSFIKMLRKNLEGQPDTVVYFDIPNVHYTFAEKVIWNVVYEARSWFSKESLTYLMENCGFEVQNVDLCWHDEYLSIEVKPTLEIGQAKLPSKENIDHLSDTVAHFSEDFQVLMDESKQKIATIQKEGKTTIAWGAGARAVTFFNLFDLKKEVPFIVDINVNRHGKYLPGSAQKIVHPEFVIEYKPDLVIITNPTYEAEITAHIKSMGLEPEFWVL